MVPTVPVVVGDDVGGVRRAGPPVRRPVRRRHGQPGAELLQPAGRPDGLRRRGPRGPGPVPGQAAARRGRRRAAGVHRPHLAARPGRPDRRADARVRRRRRHHAVGGAVRRRAGRAGSPTLRTVAEALDARPAWGSRAAWRSGRPSFSASSRASPSSSRSPRPAHLRITEELIGLQVDDAGVTAFTAIIQLGAIAAVLIYFCQGHRADHRRLRSGACAAPRRGGTTTTRWRWYVIVGSIPIGARRPGVFKDADRTAAAQPVGGRRSR